MAQWYSVVHIYIAFSSLGINRWTCGLTSCLNFCRLIFCKHGSKITLTLISCHLGKFLGVGWLGYVRGLFFRCLRNPHTVLICIPTDRELGQASFPHILDSISYFLISVWWSFYGVRQKLVVDFICIFLTASQDAERIFFSCVFGFLNFTL